MKALDEAIREAEAQLKACGLADIRRFALVNPRAAVIKAARVPVCSSLPKPVRFQ